MKVYTKTGDDGTTGLIGGTRVPKYHLRIESYGTVDELNAQIGFLCDHVEDDAWRTFLQKVQVTLFTIGSQLASDPEKSNMKLPDVKNEEVEELESSIDEMEKELTALKNFILPGGHPANSLAHICRCICRRAERLVVQVNENSPVEPVILHYLNRLSDWFFVFARYMSQSTGSKEIPWMPRNKG